LTKKGQIKKTEVIEYENYREKGIIGVKIEEGDQLLTAAITDGKRELVIATKGGMSIRFPEEQVRPMGRGTMGVKGIELDDDDVVVGLCVSDEAATACSPCASAATASRPRSESSACRAAAARASS
jgi:DNA gyrase subunit A